MNEKGNLSVYRGLVIEYPLLRESISGDVYLKEIFGE